MLLVVGDTLLVRYVDPLFASTVHTAKGYCLVPRHHRWRDLRCLAAQRKSSATRRASSANRDGERARADMPA